MVVKTKAARTSNKKFAGTPIGQAFLAVANEAAPELPDKMGCSTARQMSGPSRYGFSWYFQSRYAALVVASSPQR
jgi:hypothetical protein